MFEDLFGDIEEATEKPIKPPPPPEPEPPPVPDEKIKAPSGQSTIAWEGKLPCLKCEGLQPIRRTLTRPIEVICAVCHSLVLRQQTHWNGIDFNEIRVVETEIPQNKHGIEYTTLVREVTLDEWEGILERQPENYFQIEQIAKIPGRSEKDGLYIIYIPTEANGIEQLTQTGNEMDRTSFFKKGLDLKGLNADDLEHHIKIYGAALRACSDMQAGGMRAMMEKRELLGLSIIDEAPSNVPRNKPQQRARKGASTRKEKKDRQKFDDILSKKLGKEGFDSSTDFLDSLIQKGRKRKQEEENDDE